jgi:hypothetical protein
MPGVAEFTAASEKADLAKCTAPGLKAINDKAEQRFAAVVFLRGAHKNYDNARETLHNSFIQGTDSYPVDVTAAYHLLTHWHKADDSNQAISDNTSTSFLQSSSYVDNVQFNDDYDLF